MNASSCRFKSCYPHQRLTKCEAPSLSINPKIMTDINENALHQATWRANFLDSINLPPVHRYDQNPLPCLSSEANAFGVQIVLCRKIPSGSCFPWIVVTACKQERRQKKNRYKPFHKCHLLFYSNRQPLGLPVCFVILDQARCLW